ncbi:MAG: DUF3793 family protein [Clostridia bacterium]|nr:DUF3793 family protein [Clostridia bacterium]
MSEALLIRHCSPTLAGLKTGSLFPASFGSEKEMQRDMQDFNRRFRDKGVRIVPLRYSGGKALLYLYRPGRLERDLQHETARALLERYGYAPSFPGRCVSCLRQKMQAGDAFPHEVGLFLGYPPEDVRGFIEQGAANYKCVGCWKVYGDEQQARKTFAKYKKCTDAYCRQYAAGQSVEWLIVAG